MKTLFSIFCLLIFFNVKAQTGDFNFFTEGGERFKLMLNGNYQNENFQTSVKVPGMTAGPYSLTIFFEDKSLGIVTDKIYAEPDVEKNYAIRLKKVGESEKTAKKIFNNLNPLESQSTSDAKNREVNSQTEKYVIRPLSKVALSTAKPTPAIQSAPSESANANGKVVQAPAPKSHETFSSSHSTTTSVQSSTNGGTVAANGTSSGANVSVNLNIGTGTNTSVSSSTTYSSTTTTTHSASGTATPPIVPNHYIMPGYAGRIGCPWPMNQIDFDNVKSSIASKSFEDSKLQIAKQVAGSNCLFASQVREIMTMFTFEDSKLDFAKHAYNSTFDIDNYFKVNDAFQFELSIEELNQYLRTR